MNIKITLFALMAGFSLNILSGDGSGSRVSSKPAKGDESHHSKTASSNRLAEITSEEAQQCTDYIISKIASSSHTDPDLYVFITSIITEAQRRACVNMDKTVAKHVEDIMEGIFSTKK